MKAYKFFALTLLVTAVFTFSPPVVNAKEYTINADTIYEHIAVLASDSLEGREAGEPGEWKAAEYISNFFRQIGLKPAGDHNSYLQPFEFTKKIDISDNNRLKINGMELELHTEYLPLFQSANTEFDFDSVIPVNYGIVTDDSTYDDYAGLDVAGKAVLIKRFSPADEDSVTSDSTEADSLADKYDRYASIADKIITALDHDVSGIFLYTPEGQDDTLRNIGVTRVHPKDVPVIFLRRAGLEKLGIDITRPEIFQAEGTTELVRIPDTGYNIIGYLPGQTDKKIIIGAHYDHLGYGGPASRYRGEEKLVHHGADDNASGTAGMMELARYYTSRAEKPKHTLLFMAFSGEEKGLLGSNSYVKTMPYDSTDFLMMVNMDMIGRLREDKDDKGLGILGVGTSEEFKAYFDSLDTSDMKMTFKDAGTGPSDNTAFYNAGIPVLFYFTGVHEDYHKPSDTVGAINTEGEVKVLNHVVTTVDHFDKNFDKLTYLKTKSDEEYRGPQNFSVTLGIMPDFISEVQGLRVDGVSLDRPAERAGILKGDVIIKMGDYQVDDIYAYMNALKKFRKGDSTTVTVERGTDTLALDVIFK